MADDTDAVELLKAVIGLKAGGEVREQQQVAVEEIDTCIKNDVNLLLEAPTGSGKALDVSTPVLTVDGWKTMGTLVPGDILFDENGKRTTVLETHEPFMSEKTYELTFSDGSTIIADSEHLWATSTRATRYNDRDRKVKTFPLTTSAELGQYKNALNALCEQVPQTVSPLVLSHLGLPLPLVVEASRNLTPTQTGGAYGKYNTVNLLEQLYKTALSNLDTRTADGYSLNVHTTEEISETLHHQKHKNHAVPVAAALDFAPKLLPLNPYSFGAWLGDGSSNHATLTCHEPDLLELIREDGYHLSAHTDPHCFEWNLPDTPVNNRWHDSVTKRLRDLNVIQNKHIPDIYLQGSIAQRQALLSGLLDTDGYSTFRGNLQLSLTNEKLINDVFDLVLSLGYKPTMTSKPASYDGKTTGTCWTVSWMTNENLFKLPRKRAMFEERRKLDRFRSTNNLRYILNAEKVEPRLVRCITVDSPSHLFLAGRHLIPTHNTLSYLIPLVVNDSRAVVSTATKQLSEQALNVDVKFLNKALRELKTGKRVNAVLLKGRDNYLCLAKHAEMRSLNDEANTLFDIPDPGSVVGKAKRIASEATALSKWVEQTNTGDRSEAPPVGDDTWRQYSSTNAECPGKAACPFGNECFAEAAREAARAAQVVVTNHAIVALDLASDGTLLGDRDVFVFDELHELDNYLSSAWGAELTHKRLESVYKLVKGVPSLPEELIKSLRQLVEDYDTALRSLPTGLIDSDNTSLRLENFITTLYNVATKIQLEAGQMEKDASSDAMKRLYAGVKKTVGELADAAGVLRDTSVETIRWTSDTATARKRKERGSVRKAQVVPETKESTITFNAVPLRVGPKLQRHLTDREAIMVGVSATVTVMGGFEIPLHNFGLEKKKNRTVVLDTPFDFKKQAMLYVPAPGSFPIPVGEDRADHTAAVKRDSVDFLKAAGGAALVLTTTAYGVGDFAEHYRESVPELEFLVQGEAPNGQLVEEFKKNRDKSLIGTMGFWHGLDAPGDTLILVVIEKLPFPSPSDPKLLARKNYADKMGRNGFMEIYVTIADWMARQGFGRAIRSKNDRAVIVFYEPRLLTKNYGRAILHNFHGVGMYHDKEKVLDALRRLRDSGSKT